MNPATRTTAATFGVLVGLAGIDHGIFEILQGDVAPDGIMIAAIGPAHRFWEYGYETALTIVPSLLISGILSTLIGVIVMVWALAFIHKKPGAGILMLLSITLFLVGGGVAPIFMAVLACLTATGIDKPLKIWRMVLPGSAGRFLGKIWRGTLILLVVWFAACVGIAIFGWPLTSFYDADRAIDFLYRLSYIMVGLMCLSVLTAFAHDIHYRNERGLQAHG
jgi:hypothetical protein